jgi:diguanylate cyclase (GGDEF)-like protein/PAS domain S-box-containing protein
LLCGAVALFLVADSAWAVLALLRDYDTGTFSDLGWLLGACLFVAATEMAWREKRAPNFLRASYQRQATVELLPYIAVATGMCVLLVGILGEARDLVPLAALGILLAATVLVRQWIAARTRQDQVLATSRDLAERRLSALVERSGEVIFVLADDLRIRYASPAAGRLLGGEPVAVGALLLAAIHPADQVRARMAFDDVRARAGAEVRIEWRMAVAHGHWLPSESAISNQLEDPAVQGFVINVRDLSERQELEARLRFHSLHDALTGVANRALFIDRLMQALVRRKRHGGHVAVLLIDLDHFKLVNDSLGHLAADHVLRSVGQRLLESVRVIDTVARLGGDEFAVLLEDLGSPDEVVSVAGRLRDAMSLPMLIEARATQVGTSIGLAFAEDEDSSETLMRNAALAVYRAKAGGRSRMVVFTADMLLPLSSPPSPE